MLEGLVCCSHEHKAALLGSLLSPPPIRCHQMDDFSPAKNLMTMCFTYYYIGKGHLHPVLGVSCSA